MNICGWQIDPAAQAAIFGFALTLASEVIGMSKLKENSLLQLVLGVARKQVIPTLLRVQLRVQKVRNHPLRHRSVAVDRPDQLLPVPHEQRLQNNFDERHSHQIAN